VKHATVPLVHHNPNVVCLAMHTEQTPVPNISYFALSQNLIVIRHTTVDGRILRI